jgi:hypothetical protein
MARITSPVAAGTSNFEFFQRKGKSQNKSLKRHGRTARANSIFAGGFSIFFVKSEAIAEVPQKSVLCHHLSFSHVRIKITKIH